MRTAQAATETVAAAGQQADGRTDGGGDDGERAQIDLLDVLEALSTHFHEHHAAIMTWSWKLFCAKWARMNVQVARQERDKREREREREQERRWREWRDRHAGGGGGGW